LHDLLRDPQPLWHSRSELLEPAWLLLFYVHNVDLVQKLGNTRLQIRVRYGDSGRFQEKYSQKVRSSAPTGSEQARAVFESMFLFSWSRELAPEIHVQLIKLGFIDWTISEAAMRIPFGEGRPGATEHELLFMGKKGEDGLVGQVGVFLEVKSISRAELELGLDNLALSALDLSWSPSPGLGSMGMGGLRALGAPGSYGHPSGLGGFGGSAAASGAARPFRSSGGTPVVIGQAVPAGRVAMGTPGIAQGEALGPQPGSGSTRRSAGMGREETYREADGQVRHVLITRHPDGREERLEWTQ